MVEGSIPGWLPTRLQDGAIPPVSLGKGVNRKSENYGFSMCHSTNLKKGHRPCAGGTPGFHERTREDRGSFLEKSGRRFVKIPSNHGFRERGKEQKSPNGERQKTSEVASRFLYRDRALRSAGVRPPKVGQVLGGSAWIEMHTWKGRKIGRPGSRC